MCPKTPSAKSVLQTIPVTVNERKDEESVIEDKEMKEITLQMISDQVAIVFDRYVDVFG